MKRSTEELKAVKLIDQFSLKNLEKAIYLREINTSTKASAEISNSNGNTKENVVPEVKKSLGKDTSILLPEVNQQEK
jgi:hypothetical protein